MWDADARRAHLESVAEGGARYQLNEHVARSRPLHGDITVTLAREGAEVDTVTFSPDGTSDAATLRVARPPFSYTVTVDAVTSQAILSTSQPSF